VLTADLVEGRRRGDQLQLIAFEGERRALAERLSAELLARMRGGIGASREEVEARLGAVDAPARARKLVLGLRKILDDHAVWEGAMAIDPIALRQELFARAAAARAALTDEQRFDRAAVLGEVAGALGLQPEAIERNLFADLRSAEVLRGIELDSGAAVAERYARQQVQAVLLRALRVQVRLRCDSPGAYRAIFRQVKFLRLLFELSALDDGRYLLTIDGPYSLFESVTKYGLQLALLLPVLNGARAYELEAEVRWGKGAEQRTLRFLHHGGGDVAGSRQPLSDDGQALLDGVNAEDGPWRATVADAILSLPGVGLCVPDLLLTHRDTGEVVHVELLGYWSREAVWRRKALMEQGLAERVVWVLSSHLRVREELLDEQGSGALYVYRRVPSPRVLIERVEALASRTVRR
jgi:predicted nuclease of restriction endonuclease-like RecB superfamily